MALSMALMSASAQSMEPKNKTIDCGQVVYRTPVAAEFEVTNTSNKTIYINDVRTSCGCTTVSYPKIGVEAGATFKVRAVYDAKQMGHFEKLIGLYSDGEEKPLMLTIKGVVVGEIVDFGGSYNFTLGDVKADKNNIEFDDVNRGDRPFQKIHVMNTSNKPVQPVVMHLPNYLKGSVSPSTIAPGHAGVVTITLDSRNLTDFGLKQTSVFLGMYPGDKVSADKEISISAVVLPSFDEMTNSQKALAPQIQLSDSVLNLGEFNGKKKLKGEILITNMGKSTLDIRSVQMFTVGIQMSLNKTRLAPGEVAKMKIEADAKRLKLARSVPRILMITNDPKMSKVVITIYAK